MTKEPADLHPRRRRFRSQLWFDNPEDPGMTALYFERYLNFGLNKHELMSGRPIIGIAHADVIGQKHHVEFGALRRAGDLHIVLEIDAGVGLGARMPPRGHVVAGRIEEGAEPHLGLGRHS